MKVGDLVRFGPGHAARDRVRMGIVVEVHYRATAVVRWNGIKSTMVHRQDLLEVVSEGR